MRPVEPGMLPGNACPVLPTEAPQINITLEKSDGWRFDAPYRPIFLLPAGSYVSIELEIVDSSGKNVLHRETLALGPDDSYPWMVPVSQISSAPQMHSMAYAGATACGDTCRYSSDGVCDDGGPGATFAHCENATDCADCGSRPPGERRLKESSTLFMPQQALPWEASSTEGDIPTPTPTPGTRQLLKGGGGSHGGRPSVVGRDRWGGMPVTRRTTHTPHTPQTNAGVYYVVAGRSYGVSTRAYEYEQASAVYGRHEAILVVGSEGYGCYSCSGDERTCQNCPDDCTKREQCAGERPTDVQYALDRYELGITLHIPEEGSSRWPMRMRIHDATIFISRGSLPSTGADVMLSFYTQDGLAWQSAYDIITPCGWILVVVGFCCVTADTCCQDDSAKSRRHRKRGAPHRV
eukprot:CAMPEP_0115830794 /NCGR_PEP_ID=MMETSP0287-20121206/1802_1 /TAXON_ID=412157 /ORGANISM="Chrysochromulina rotalis, Strain UIO044" /LENGTH=406 /DNA_ID=CAMNT_0003284111 /DNA_START=59 /DNA_END=1279 /DNA_ORIENTATION=+